MKERITTKPLPGGAVLLEKEIEQPDLIPDDLKLENIAPLPERQIICQFCLQHGKRTPAVAVIIPSQFGLSMLPVEMAPEEGTEFVSMCQPHAERAAKQIRKRVRKIKRYSTNLYTRTH